MDGPGILVRTDLKGKILRQEAFPDAADYPWNPEGMERRAVFDTADGTLLCEWEEAEHLGIIKEYIALLLDYENQFTVYGCSARKDVAQNCLTDKSPDGRLWKVNGKNGDSTVVKQIELKPDGTSYLEEYLAFLEGCVPEPEYPSAIVKILSEEMDPYLAGDKNVDGTIEVIQNRVQLYLDER